MSDLREDLRAMVFKASGGITDMGDTEIDAVLDAVIKSLPAPNFGFKTTDATAFPRTVATQTGALAVHADIIAFLESAKRGDQAA